MRVWTTAEFVTELQQERPGFDAVLQELLCQHVCPRCCLRFSGVTSFSSDRSTLSHQFPTAGEVLSHLRNRDRGEEQNGPRGPTDGGSVPETADHDMKALTEAVPTCPVCVGFLQSFERGAHTVPDSLLKSAITKLDLQPNALQLQQGSVKQVADSLRCDQPAYI